MTIALNFKHGMQANVVFRNTFVSHLRGCVGVHYTYSCKCIQFVMLCACNPLKLIHIPRKLVISIIIQETYVCRLGGSGERYQKYLRGQSGDTMLCTSTHSLNV